MREDTGSKPQARSHVYQFLSAGFSYPTPALVELLHSTIPHAERGLSLLETGHAAAVLQALRLVLQPYTADQLEAEYISTFGHTISKECPPYESEYGQAHIFQKSQALADVAGFYGAFGLEADPSFQERLDHISVEMEFMHFLCLKEAYAVLKGHSEEQLAVCREAQAKFLGEHLGQWVLEFARRLEAKAGGNVYGLVGQLMAAFVARELQAFGVEPSDGRSPSPDEPLAEEPAACETCPLLAPAAGGGT